MSQENEENEVEEEENENDVSVKYAIKDLQIKEFSSEELERLEKCTISELLRQNQAGLCEIIYQSRNLWRKFLYCFSLTMLFGGIYGAILVSKSGLIPSLVMACKVPLLLIAMLLVCGPLLFTMNLFLGIHLNILQTTIVLLVTSYLISCFLLASAGILLVFVLYSPGTVFLNILNIIFFGIAVGFGIAFLWRSNSYFIQRSDSPANTFAIKVWTVIYVLAGLQLAWGIQVFGDLSELPLFKQMKVEGNFYMVIFQIIQRWIGG